MGAGIWVVYVCTRKNKQKISSRHNFQFDIDLKCIVSCKLCEDLYGRLIFKSCTYKCGNNCHKDSDILYITVLSIMCMASRKVCLLERFSGRWYPQPCTVIGYHYSLWSCCPLHSFYFCFHIACHESLSSRESVPLLLQTNCLTQFSNVLSRRCLYVLTLLLSNFTFICIFTSFAANEDKAPFYHCNKTVCCFNLSFRFGYSIFHPLF